MRLYIIKELEAFAINLMVGRLRATEIKQILSPSLANILELIQSNKINYITNTCTELDMHTRIHCICRIRNTTYIGVS